LGNRRRPQNRHQNLLSPFTKVDSEEDYRRAWEEFEKRYQSEVSSDKLPVSSEY